MDRNRSKGNSITPPLVLTLEKWQQAAKEYPDFVTDQDIEYGLSQDDGFMGVVGREIICFVVKDHD